MHRAATPQHDKGGAVHRRYLTAAAAACCGVTLCFRAHATKRWIGSDCTTRRSAVHHSTVKHTICDLVPCTPQTPVMTRSRKLFNESHPKSARQRLPCLLPSQHTNNNSQRSPCSTEQHRCRLEQHKLHGAPASAPPAWQTLWQACGCRRCGAPPSGRAGRPGRSAAAPLPGSRASCTGRARPAERQHHMPKAERPVRVKQVAAPCGRPGVAGQDAVRFRGPEGQPALYST